MTPRILALAAQGCGYYPTNGWLRCGFNQNQPVYGTYRGIKGLS